MRLLLVSDDFIRIEKYKRSYMQKNRQLFIAIPLITFVGLLPFTWAFYAMYSNTTDAFLDVSATITGVEACVLGIMMFVLVFTMRRMGSGGFLSHWDLRQRESFQKIGVLIGGIIGLSIVGLLLLNYGPWRLELSVIFAFSFSIYLEIFSLFILLVALALLNNFQVLNSR